MAENEDAPRGTSTVTAGPGAPAGQQTSQSDQPQGQSGGGTLAAQQQANQDPSRAAIGTAGGGATSGSIGRAPAGGAGSTSPASSGRSSTSGDEQQRRQQLMSRGINPDTNRRYDETVPGGVYRDDKGRFKDAHGNYLSKEDLEGRGLEVNESGHVVPKGTQGVTARNIDLTDSERVLRNLQQPVPPAPEEEQDVAGDEETVTVGEREYTKRSFEAAHGAGADAGEPGRPSAHSVKAAEEGKSVAEKEQREREERERQTGQRQPGPSDTSKQGRNKPSQAGQSTSSSTS